MVLVEKAPRTGGSAEYAGFIWTAPTFEVMREVNPNGDPALARRLVDGYPDAIEWVRSLAVDIKEPVTVLGYGRDRQTDMPQLLSTCERIVRDRVWGRRRLTPGPSPIRSSAGGVPGAESDRSS